MAPLCAPLAATSMLPLGPARASSGMSVAQTPLTRGCEPHPDHLVAPNDDINMTHSDAPNAFKKMVNVAEEQAGRRDDISTHVS